MLFLNVVSEGERKRAEIGLSLRTAKWVQLLGSGEKQGAPLVWAFKRMWVVIGGDRRKERRKKKSCV